MSPLCCQYFCALMVTQRLMTRYVPAACPFLWAHFNTCIHVHCLQDQNLLIQGCCKLLLLQKVVVWNLLSFG
jgi:hypothetical protein